MLEIKPSACDLIGWFKWHKRIRYNNINLVLTISQENVF